MESDKHLQEEIQDQPNELDILAHLPISDEEADTLAENGFDDVESLKFLDINTLVALGISEPEKVYEACQNIISQFQEDEGMMPTPDGGMIAEEEEDQEYVYDSQKQQFSADMENEGDYQNSGEKNIVNIEVKTPKVVTQQMIVQTLASQQSKLSNSAAQNYMKTMKGSNLVQNLQKLTHLHLNNKRIQRIGDEMEKYCKNIKVLYLFDNYIDKIEGLTSLKGIVQLSLYNNQISKMEGLEGLPLLRKLYLEKNRISRLEGLTACRQLEELYLSNQDTQSDFTFDDYSLAAISSSLRYLDLSESRVSEPSPLYYLERLEVLILKRNRIQDFEEQVCPILQTMNSLRQLDLTDNPVTQIPKYRDQVIIMTGQRLQEIDNKKVTQQERTYLMQLVQRKQRTAMGGQKEEQKAATGGVKGMEVSGKNKTLHEGMYQQQPMQQQQIPVKQHMMTGTHGSLGTGSDGNDTGYQFYSPLDDHKQVLKQRTNIANISYQNQAMMKKRSVNLNGNNDFTAAGVTHMATKHIPKMPGAAEIKR